MKVMASICCILFHARFIQSTWYENMKVRNEHILVFVKILYVNELMFNAATLWMFVSVPCQEPVIQWL